MQGRGFVVLSYARLVLSYARQGHPGSSRPALPGPGRNHGGSVGLCDPDAGVAFGYVTSLMGPRWQNPRNRALIDAVFACV